MKIYSHNFVKFTYFVEFNYFPVVPWEFYVWVFMAGEDQPVGGLYDGRIIALFDW